MLDPKASLTPEVQCTPLPCFDFSSITGEDPFFRVQVRVMPSCWYILQRFFLRVDKHLVRVHDLRIMCDLTSPKQSVIREILHMEGSYEELSATQLGKTPVCQFALAYSII